MGNTPAKPESKYFGEFEAGLPSLAGKTIAVTGCTSGTGLVFATTCARKEAKHILMLNRPSERATQAEAVVKAAAATTSHVETVPCDLQDFASVDKAIQHITSKYDSVDVLCNNAGVMALEDYATKDGYDVQMQTNHLSHFKLTQGLFPLLQKAAALRGQARIVHHSSAARHGPALKPEYFDKNGGHLGGNGNSMFFGGARWKRYQQTKLANSVFTAALASRLKGTGVMATVAAPGLSATNLQTTTQADGGMDAMWIMRFAQSAEDGTMPLLAAAFDATTVNGDFWEPQNQMNCVGPAVKVKIDKATADPENAKVLWEMSEQACGKFEIN